MLNIIVVTSHPDDELIWIGNTLYELNKMEFINIHIICLWTIFEKNGNY